MIAVDSNFISPEAEENIRRTIPELQRLVNEIIKG
jgi:hypothetical protein